MVLKLETEKQTFAVKMEMTSKSDLIRTFVKGGFVSPADLLKVMDISKAFSNRYLLFGSRQDVMFPANGASEQKVERTFRDLKINYELCTDNSVYQNIVSSYVAVNVVETTHWVKEDTYHFVIDNFDFKPRLKINIVDPVQTIVPLLTGELNFIASREENYWYLYIRDSRKANIEIWPQLIFSQDIAKVSRALEDLMLNYPPTGVAELFVNLQGLLRVNHRSISEKLKFPVGAFPYYEGLNAMLNNQYWLGLYWRDNKYDIDFLTAACRLCQETNIGKINIIPWKAFIIKGIKTQDRIRWQKLMGKFGINERHSSIELNWHLPVIDDDALNLKRFLVRELDHLDISTHGLTFTIKMRRDTYLFTTIVIELNVNSTSSDRYNILYARNFDPNSTVYYPYARDVRKEIIPALLIELSKLYYRQLNPEKDKVYAKDSEETVTHSVASYQCSNCLTVYDKKYGDPLANIPPGVSFDELPESYVCNVCNSPKKYFVARNESLVQKN